jgi:hypothetical protein
LLYQQLQVSLQASVDQNHKLEEQLKQQQQHQHDQQQRMQNKITSLESALTAADISSRRNESAAAAESSSHKLTQQQLQESRLRENANRQALASQVTCVLARNYFHRNLPFHHRHAFHSHAFYSSHIIYKFTICFIHQERFIGELQQQIAVSSRAAERLKVCMRPLAVVCTSYTVTCFLKGQGVASSRRSSDRRRARYCARQTCHHRVPHHASPLRSAVLLALCRNSADFGA